METTGQIGRSAAALGFALTLFGCQDYLFEQKCPEGVTESELTVPAAEPTPADILFVVDNSGSMADEQENLARNFEFFINQIAGTGDQAAGDYRIAVVTTDLISDGGERGGTTTYGFGDGPYMAWDLTVDGSCESVGIPHACFRGPSPETRVIRIAEGDDAQTRQAAIAAFQENVRVGSCGSGDEQGLAAMREALMKTGQGQCNEGFVRPDANLVVIIVSDENEVNLANRSPQQYANDLTTITGKPASQIRVAAIVGAVDGEATSCSIGQGAACGTLCERGPPPAGSHQPCSPGDALCPDGETCDFQQDDRCETYAEYSWNNTFCEWCSYYQVDDCCSALAGSRYVEFARAVESRVAAETDITPTNCQPEAGQRAACLVDSICQEEFGETLERIARELVIDNTYTLTPPAQNPDGITVRISGGRYPEGRELDPDEFSITDQGSRLVLREPTQENETIEIFYISEISRPTEPRGACGIDAPED